MITIVFICIYRNELITSTWIEDPNERPTFETILLQLSKILGEMGEAIYDSVETTESDSYISILPK